MTRDLIKSRPWGRVPALAALLVLGCSAGHGSLSAGFRFVVWGDATDVLPHVVTNAAQIHQLRVQPKFNLFVGDLYDTGFSRVAAQALHAAMGSPLSDTMFPVRGNHDIIGGSKATTDWQAWFDLAARVSRIGASNYAWMPDCNSLTYSFDYENCHFVGLDIPGDVTLVQPSQLRWLDADLTATEVRGREHTFLFLHGPVYSSGSRHGGIDAPAAMFDVLNAHRSVSAVFGGHAHVFAWTQMYTNRIAGLTRSFEAFIVPPVAESIAALDDTNRCDYGMGNIRGFTTVDVDGRSFTITLYVQDKPGPVFTRTFPRLPSLRSPVFSPQESRFLRDGEPGQSRRINKSGDGVNWIPMSTNTILASPLQVVTGSIDRIDPRRFHACVLGP